MEDYPFEKLERRKTLITGEVDSGKTRLTASLLQGFIERGRAEEITVLDFAPPRSTFGPLSVGGRIKDYLPDVPCRAYEFSEGIRAPRLEGKDADEVREIARRNAEITSTLIGRYLDSPTPCLFVNDLTIHLHAGDVGLLLRTIGRSETFVGSAYRGARLSPDHGSGVSRREADLLREVESLVDVSIPLPSGSARRGSC